MRRSGEGVEGRGGVEGSRVEGEGVGVRRRRARARRAAARAAGRVEESSEEPVTCDCGAATCRQVTCTCTT